MCRQWRWYAHSWQSARGYILQDRRSCAIRVRRHRCRRCLQADCGRWQTSRYCCIRRWRTCSRWPRYWTAYLSWRVAGIAACPCRRYWCRCRNRPGRLRLQQQNTASRRRLTCMGSWRVWTLFAHWYPWDASDGSTCCRRVRWNRGWWCPRCSPVTGNSGCPIRWYRRRHWAVAGYCKSSDSCPVALPRG